MLLKNPQKIAAPRCPQLDANGSNAKTRPTRCSICHQTRALWRKKRQQSYLSPMRPLPPAVLTFDVAAASCVAVKCDRRKSFELSY